MAVVAISSLVMRGSVGLRATVFALERRGAEVWSVPTVLMPWHPGLGPSTRTAMPDVAAQLRELGAHAAAVDAVVTGYFATPEQVEAAGRFIDAVRAARADALIAVDPVMGDEMGRYVPDAVAEAIARELIPRADVATPNRFELNDLTGGLGGLAGARALGPRTVVTTSAVETPGETGAMLVSGDAVWVSAHPAVEPAARGTGDLFVGVLVSALLGGASHADALAAATAATYAVTARSGAQSLALAAQQSAIANPPYHLAPLREAAAPAPLAAATARGAWRDAPVVYGVDGCPNGWAVVTIASTGPLAAELRLVDDLAPLIGTGAMAIDIPIGLPDRIDGAGRAAEQMIRPLLGERAPSVFSMPSRAAVYAADWEEACARAAETSTPARRVSKQAFVIFPKIREVDALVSPLNQDSVFETHAEMAFWRLNGERPMPTAKSVKGVRPRDALADRIALLVEHGFDAAFFEEQRPRGVPLVDLVDAAALALIARRCRDGVAQPYPDPPEIDGRGLRAAIWA